MLIDLHAHTSGISWCCKIPYDQILEHAKNHEIDGIVLTNHYQKLYVKDDKAEEFAERYVKEFYTTKKCGDELGCKVFFGIEVTMELYPKVHMLIYGVDPEFVKENPRMYNLTQEELYSKVKSAGGLLVQAHPFRNGTTVLDTDYLDGIEINCHPIYKNSYSEDILRIAKENHLLVTCGGDYHADTYRPKCGMFIPDNISDNKELVSFMLSDSEKKLCIQEPNCEEDYIISV